MLTGNVLITGGAGFLGRGIIRRATEEQWPCNFTVYSRDETKQWELKHRYPNVNCILGDVARDFDRLMTVMVGHQTVIHAGAVKYIPEAEHNVFETCAVNIEGSRNVAFSAIAAGVRNVVGISTDKACQPSNLYGMTKAVMERMFSEANKMGNTRFTTIRYGNVIGSTGSVIPLFKRQIADKGCITITDMNMTRFWLSIDDAVGLIEYAVKNVDEVSGVTMISRCQSMRIFDLAQAIWDVEKPNSDLCVEVIGMRPGEKLHENLYSDQEAVRVFDTFDSNIVTLHPATVSAPSLRKDMSGYCSDNPISWMLFSDMVEAIEDAANV